MSRLSSSKMESLCFSYLCKASVTRVHPAAPHEFSPGRKKPTFYRLLTSWLSEWVSERTLLEQTAFWSVRKAEPNVTLPGLEVMILRFQDKFFTAWATMLLFFIAVYVLCRSRHLFFLGGILSKVHHCCFFCCCCSWWHLGRIWAVRTPCGQRVLAGKKQKQQHFRPFRQSCLLPSSMSPGCCYSSGNGEEAGPFSGDAFLSIPLRLVSDGNSYCCCQWCALTEMTASLSASSTNFAFTVNFSFPITYEAKLKNETGCLI